MASRSNCKHTKQRKIESMKNVCVITAARSEYGVLRWIIDILSHDKEIQFQLIVTGSHLSKDFGLTYHFIEEDGYKIDDKVDMELTPKDLYSIPRSMGLCAEKMGYAFHRLKPDIIIILGDRYELLPIANTALVLNIPIAHISGGDITKGAIDNEVRNAISMMATLHFPSTEDSAKRLHRMLGTTHNIYPVGEPGLDSFFRYKPMTRIELASQLQLDSDKKWILVTLHSETKKSMNYNMAMVQNLYKAIQTFPQKQYIITKANSDFGGIQINSFWDSLQDKNIRVITSLGQQRYLSLMHQVECILGNSSSGIIEAPFLGIPVINIGERQKGRHMCKNVICCNIDVPSIITSINQIDNFKIIDQYWGDGNASERIAKYVKEFVNRN